MLVLQFRFRTSSMRWQLDDDDIVEVWDGAAHEHLLTVKGELLKTLLRHHLDALAITALLKLYTERKPAAKMAEAPMPETAPIDRARREVLRARRKTRPK